MRGRRLLFLVEQEVVREQKDSDCDGRIGDVENGPERVTCAALEVEEVDHVLESDPVDHVSNGATQRKAERRADDEVLPLRAMVRRDQRGHCNYRDDHEYGVTGLEQA